MTTKRFWLGYFAALSVAVGLVVWGATLFFSAMEADAQVKVTPGGGGGIFPPGASATTTSIVFGPEEFDLDIAVLGIEGALTTDTDMTFVKLVDGGDSGVLTNFVVPADWDGESVGVYLWLLAKAVEDDEVLLEARYLDFESGVGDRTDASTVIEFTLDVRTSAGSGGDIDAVNLLYRVDLGDMTGLTAGRLMRITIMRDGDGGADDWEQDLHMAALEMTP